MGTHQLSPGTVLGRYELLLPIASGGMATVWVARSKGTRGFSKTVAVKTILPNLSDDPMFEQMFLDEATLASKIQHPNVAQIIDLGEQDEILYLAMEWVDGESLSTLAKLAKKNSVDIPIRVGVKIVAQACAGLHAAHELRDDEDRLLELVHRDVSPQNILISTLGAVKIVDFGVAKALGRSGETSAGQLKGKVPFMSPEQAKGAMVDRRTDIFALGIILYRLVTGTHPFLDETDIKTMRNIITRPPMPPRVRNPQISHELERIILKALQRDVDRRYPTAQDLESDLETFLANTASADGRPVAPRSDLGAKTDVGLIGAQEVAAFVRETLGDRDTKRKAAIREAALRVDQLGAMGGVEGNRKSLVRWPGGDSLAGAPPSLSGVAAPKVTSLEFTDPGVDVPSDEEAESEGVTQALALNEANLGELLQGKKPAPSAALSSPPSNRGNSEPHLVPSSPTLAAVSVQGPSPGAPARRNRWLFPGALAVAAASLTTVWVASQSDEHSTESAPTSIASSPAASIPASGSLGDGTELDLTRIAEGTDAASSATGEPTPSSAPQAASVGAPVTQLSPAPVAGPPPRKSAIPVATSAPPPPPTTTVEAPPKPSTTVVAPTANPKPSPVGPAVQDPGF